MPDSSTQSDKKQEKKDVRIEHKINQIHANVVHLASGDIKTYGEGNTNALTMAFYTCFTTKNFRVVYFDSYKANTTYNYMHYHYFFCNCKLRYICLSKKYHQIFYVFLIVRQSLFLPIVCYGGVLRVFLLVCKNLLTKLQRL